MKLFGKIAWTFAAATAIALGFSGQLIANPPTSTALVLDELGKLERLASLVRGARAEYAVSFLQNTSDESQRYDRFMRMSWELGREGGQWYSGGGDRSRDDYQAIWLRNGILEREEQTKFARPANATTIIYDGKTVKTLDDSPRRARLTVDSPQSGWIHANRIEPFAFAFEFRNQSHADIVRASPRRSAVRVVTDKGPRTEITARHPGEKSLTVKLIYDEQFRLLSRELLSTRPVASLLVMDEGGPTLVSRHEFSNHRPYDDGEGNTIWYPNKIVLRYFLGAFPDGTPVQDYAIQIDIRKMEFNVPLEKDRFELKKPAGVHQEDNTADTSFFARSVQAY